MHKTLYPVIAMLLLSGLFASAHPARADDFILDVDTKFRAKIAKEKAKAASTLSAADKNAKTGDAAECGSQNIGNVDTGNRPGAAPREVFVFAPNAINLVNARGCN